MTDCSVHVKTIRRDAYHFTFTQLLREYRWRLNFFSKHLRKCIDFNPLRTRKSMNSDRFRILRECKPAVRAIRMRARYGTSTTHHLKLWRKDIERRLRDAEVGNTLRFSGRCYQKNSMRPICIDCVGIYQETVHDHLPAAIKILLTARLRRDFMLPTSRKFPLPATSHSHLARCVHEIPDLASITDFAGLIVNDRRQYIPNLIRSEATLVYNVLPSIIDD